VIFIGSMSLITLNSLLSQKSKFKSTVDLNKEASGLSPADSSARSKDISELDTDLSLNQKVSQKQIPFAESSDLSSQSTQGKESDIAKNLTKLSQTSINQNTIDLSKMTSQLMSFSTEVNKSDLASKTTQYSPKVLPESNTNLSQTLTQLGTSKVIKSKFSVLPQYSSGSLYSLVSMNPTSKFTAGGTYSNGITPGANVILPELISYFELLGGSQYIEKVNGIPYFEEI
jgi:hypothetical protein